MISNMKTLQTPLLAIAVVAAILFLGYSLSTVKAADSNGNPVTIATSTTAVVTNTAALVFATSTCSARVISTSGNSAIMIGFAERVGFVPNGLQGIWQAASTTVAYDGSQYGCGAVRIFSYGTQNITVQEGR